MNAAELTQALKSAAAEMGFPLTGVCAATAPPGIPHFDRWLAAEYHGEMHYLPQRRAAYDHPQSVLAEVKSILMLGSDYSPTLASQVGPGRGRVARYATGAVDYHDQIRDRLNQLGAQLTLWTPDVAWRGVVDTAPLLEREFAQLAGLGWQAKNTMLINPRRGSWFFLAALLVSCELIADQPFTTDHCGTCRACLDACPTKAFIQPHVLDARRCISYLTIEHRSPIPADLRASMGDWVFGCDICQEVCPWNRFADEPVDRSYEPQAELNPLELSPLFSMTDEAFRQRFRATPLWRPKRRGLLRNAAIALGNQRDPSAIPALALGLFDVEPLVRGAAAWALGRIASTVSRSHLERRFAMEIDEYVRSEIQAALLTAPALD